MLCFSSNMPNRDPVICQEFLPPDFSTAVDNHSFFLQFHIFISSQHTDLLHVKRWKRWKSSYISSGLLIQAYDNKLTTGPTGDTFLQD